MLSRPLLLCGFLLFTVSNAVGKDGLRAGAAAVDVTPKIFPLNMPGGHSANMADSAHDPLNSRALVLDDGRVKLAMVVVDNLGAGPEVLDEVKAIASEKTGIPADRMLISSTHTHTGASLNREAKRRRPIGIFSSMAWRSRSFKLTLHCNRRQSARQSIRCPRRSLIAASSSSRARCP